MKILIASKIYVYVFLLCAIGAMGLSGCGVSPGFNSPEATGESPTRAAVRSTRTPRSRMATPTQVSIELPTETSAPSSNNALGQMPVIGEIFEIDDWQFVVDSVEISPYRPDGTNAVEGHQFVVVAFTIKNNSTQCRILQTTAPKRDIDVPRRFDGGALFASDFSPAPHPLIVPWILDARNYGHSGYNDGLYSGYTFNAPPHDVVPLAYWFDVPVANSQKLELYLENVSGLDGQNIVFDLTQKAAAVRTLKPELAPAPIPIGQEATFGDHWAMTVTGLEQGQGRPFNRGPVVSQTTVLARVRNLQGIDAAFPRTELNPQGTNSDFYLLNNQTQSATITSDLLSQLSNTMAPGLERDIQIPTFSLAPMSAGGLRFTAIVDIYTCEYAHFDLGGK